MPAAAEIDRKLHLIVRNSDADQYPTAIALGRALERQRPIEFSYQRTGKTEYAAAITIAAYVLYARDVGILDGDFRTTRPKNEIRSLENFQNWLSDKVSEYLNNRGASLENIEARVRALLSASPCELPTLDNLHRNLKDDIPKEYLRLSLKVLSILRRDALQLKSKRLIILPTVVRA